MKYKPNPAHLDAYGRLMVSVAELVGAAVIYDEAVKARRESERK